MKYRLLQEGERIRKGDQYYDSQSGWQNISCPSGNYAETTHAPIRRQINDKWINDRGNIIPPTLSIGSHVWFVRGGKVGYCRFSGDKTGWTVWRYADPSEIPEAPKSPDAVAFESWKHSYKGESLTIEEAFKAGWSARGNK